jgi:hypothetical protein
MRLAFLLSIFCLAAAGCSSQRGSGTQRVPATTRGTVRTNAPQITVSPANTTAVGRVALLNAGGRFVILTCPIGKLPRLGQRLSVYRNGMKVGELIVTEPQHDQNTAADIVAGEAQTGDEVRLN